MSATHRAGLRVGNYVIVEKLGAGGMGAVYLAEHPEIGRRVAVKMLAPNLTRDPDVAERFIAEARAVTRIDHPNVIEIYDFGRTEDDTPYFIMELLDGDELLKVIDRGPMTPQQAHAYVVQICAALQAAHDKGIVHRDLKPENIFVLRRDNSIKILDFGLAKLLEQPQGESLTRTGMVMGTPLTISPEQAAGETHRISPATDIYSLGVILYWMLSGRPPFHSQPSVVLLCAHVSERPTPLRQNAPHLPERLTRLIDRCLEKQPRDRPHSATEISREFSAAIGGAVPATLPPATNPNARVGSYASGIAVGGGGAMGGGGGGGATVREPTRQHSTPQGPGFGPTIAGIGPQPSARSAPSWRHPDDSNPNTGPPQRIIRPSERVTTLRGATGQMAPATRNAYVPHQPQSSSKWPWVLLALALLAGGVFAGKYYFGRSHSGSSGAAAAAARGDGFNIEVRRGRQVLPVDILAEGKLLYSDRSYTFHTIPSQYRGLRYVRMINADKRLKARVYLTVTTNRSATFYIAYDQRADRKPVWMTDWQSTGDVVKTSDATLKVFAKTLPAGQFVLSANEAGGATGAHTHYLIFVRPL